ncbi:restriction endonuclease subunit S [Mycoplasma aquilae ATCC BAA-1896]|uniref:restriction endonuclease subunit S n=1 Tax=Mycoplasma aquilae TaxID=1312741 RepID=UPI003A86D331
MQKEKLVPEIRFKGFEGKWVEYELGSLYSFLKGSNLSQDSFYYSNAKKAIAYGHLYTIYGPVINAVHLSSNEKTSLISKENDLLFPGSSTVPLGTAQANAIMLNGIKLGADIICARPIKDNVDSQFVSYQINAQKYKLFPIISGTTISHMYASGLKNTKWKFTALNEQSTISDFFNNLLILIQSQELKLKKLNEVKQSLLNKMFASENQKFPEIRFKGFDEPWKLKKFSDLYNCNNEKNINIRYTEKNIISVANMYFKNEQKISNTEYLKSYNIFHLGDIAYEGHKSANYRYGRFVVNTIGSGIVSHVFEVFKPVMKEYDLYFWKYYINNENIMRNVLRDSTKSATMMAALVKKDLSNQFIKTTSIVEQQKIGAFFSSLDSLIRSQELKLEKLNNIKQALLEKMFC